MTSFFFLFRLPRGNFYIPNTNVGLLQRNEMILLYYQRSYKRDVIVVQFVGIYNFIIIINVVVIVSFQERRSANLLMVIKQSNSKGGTFARLFYTLFTKLFFSGVQFKISFFFFAMFSHSSTVRLINKSNVTKHILKAINNNINRVRYTIN